MMIRAELFTPFTICQYFFSFSFFFFFFLNSGLRNGSLQLFSKRTRAGRFEERKQVDGLGLGFRVMACLKSRDKDFSSLGHSNSKPGHDDDDDDDQFIDYIGICIWDDQRLGLL
jgi:hypothetical protein